MSILLSAHELSKSFHSRALFSGLTFAIESGERIGLIGPNGAGKSTLLRILASLISPDEGKLSLQRGLKVGYLEQNPVFQPQATILSSVLEGTEDPDDWEAVSLAHEFISKLDLDSFGSETLITTLSGGWQRRVALARELVKNPDLLLLDEPTNHLDVESILWLEGFLSKARFATFTITHDRLFLQRIANRILELDPRHEGGLLSVKGDYSAYLEAREQLISGQERREVILKNTLRRETEWLRQGAKARTTKQQARIQRQGELANEVEELTLRNQSRMARIDFQSAEKNPKKLITAEKISKRYGTREIFAPLDLMITPGTRIGLLGRNGSGKSTLIRVLLGIEEPTSGKITRSGNLSVAYFDQIREALDPEIPLSKTLCPIGEYVDFRGSKVHIKSYLDRFLFTKQQMDLPIGKLSGGERSRVLIARLMLTEANLLVLDEPTNDLDLATLTVLQECLEDFPGAVILVTHDRYFLDQVSNKILAFGSGTELVSFSDLAQWEKWHASLPVPRKLSTSETAQKNEISSPTKKRKLSFNEQRELDSMEANIHEAEEKLKRLEHESTLPENTSHPLSLSKITKEMAETQAKIQRFYERWEELENR